MNTNSETNAQCLEMNELASPPGKNFCLLTKILCGCVLGLIGVCTLAFLLYQIFDFVDDAFGEAIGIILLTVLFSSPFIGVGSLIRINLHPDQFRGRVISSLLLAFSCFLVFQAAYMMVPAAKRYGIARGVVCGTNVKGLGTAITVLVPDYDGILPSHDWCDRLVEEADVSPKSLRCPLSDSVIGESDYCLNKHAAGKKLSELPADMVLLFESFFVPDPQQAREPIRNRNGFSDLPMMSDIFKGDEEVYLDRWNRVGGPELLTYDRHDGCNILFADGHTAFVKLPELSDLRWNIEGDVFFVASQSVSRDSEIGKWPQITLKTALMSLLVGVCTLAALCIVVRFKTLKYLPFVLTVAIFSAGTGLFLGNMSEQAYLSESFTGRNAGGIFGLLTGVCFAVLLANAPDRIKNLRTFKGFSASVGMATGIICSTLVHLALIIVNEETNFAGILIGIPYGVFAGAVLGFVSGFLVETLYCRKALNQQ
jgi:prepilin-type processing-associated H-X9-DG protein